MHHFVTVGRYAYVAGATRVVHDVPPYVKAAGYDQEVRGLNVEGLRRWHVPEESVCRLRQATRVLYARRHRAAPLRTAEALGLIESDGLADDAHVRYLVDFLKRKLAIGVFGRVREHYRSDQPADYARFYQSKKLECPGE